MRPHQAIAPQNVLPHIPPPTVGGGNQTYRPKGCPRPFALFSLGAGVTPAPNEKRAKGRGQPFGRYVWFPPPTVGGGIWGRTFCGAIAWWGRMLRPAFVQEIISAIKVLHPPRRE